MATESRQLRQTLLRRGVVMPAPEAVVLEDLDPQRVAPGVVLHPGTTLRGRRTLLGAGTELGLAGGGCFQDIGCGPGVRLWGGHHQDAVYLDGVQLRGHAEVRAGTLLEEGCQGGQHLGLKMTVLLANTAVGSLVNFCDAIVAGGPSASRHSEIGSCTALYNFSPQGDKWASIFGDPFEGLIERSAPVFIGGQTQVVSPVRIGPGTVIPAGAAVRRDVPGGRLYAEAGPVMDLPFDPALYGPLERKLDATFAYIGTLAAIAAWYDLVRGAWARGAEAHTHAELYRMAAEQLRVGVAERIGRLDQLIGRLPVSSAAHRMALDTSGDAARRPWHQACLAEQSLLIDRWPVLRQRIQERAASAGQGAGPSQESPTIGEALKPLALLGARLATDPSASRTSFRQARASIEPSLLDDATDALRSVAAWVAQGGDSASIT